MKNHWHSNNKQRQAAYKYGYRSGLELKVADQIKEAKYPVNYETETLKYIVPQKNSKYTPDFIFTKKDGKTMYFTSDMPGGFGGYDLYASYLEDGRWSPPLNLGPSVNTEGNEVFPFHHESGTLYFASNGLVGMGGLDIYKTTDSYGAWTDPINLGYPINTVDDDFGFIINSEQTHGYFSSNRKGKGGTNKERSDGDNSARSCGEGKERG